MSELKIFLYLMLNVAYKNQLHLSHLLPRLKLFIPSFYFYCSSYFTGSSGHLGHLDVMPCPFLWQWQLRGRYHEIPKISPGAYFRNFVVSSPELPLPKERTRHNIKVSKMPTATRKITRAIKIERWYKQF